MSMATTINAGAPAFGVQLQTASRYIQQYVPINGRLSDLDAALARKAHAILVRDVLKPNNLSDEYAAQFKPDAVPLPLSSKERKKFLQPLREVFDAQAAHVLKNPISVEVLEQMQLGVSVLMTAHHYVLLSCKPGRQLVDAIKAFLRREEGEMHRRAKRYANGNVSLSILTGCGWDSMRFSGKPPLALVVEDRILEAPKTSVRKNLTLAVTLTASTSGVLSGEAAKGPRLTLKVDERSPMFAELNGIGHLSGFLHEVMARFSAKLEHMNRSYPHLPPVTEARFKGHFEEIIYLRMLELLDMMGYGDAELTGVSVE